MRRLSRWWLVPSFALAACGGGSSERPAESPPAEAAASGAASGPVGIVAVIYNHLKDTVAVEKYSAETHVPLVGATQGEIGVTKAELTGFTGNVDGSAPAFYRQAELYFEFMDALTKGIAPPGFKTVANDLGHFATGGLTAMIAVETK